MVRTLRRISLVACLSLGASSARASEPPSSQPQPQSQAQLVLSYEQALTLARTQAPTQALVRARVAESEARVEAAEVRPLNPRILANVGPRVGADGTSVDASVRATQWLEVGGQRGNRVDAARAGVEASEARGEDAQRLLLREVSLTFIRALYWQRRVKIATDKLELARAAEAVARRRHELGDIGGLEESSASLAVAHAQVELAQACAALDLSEGQLAALLGLEAGTSLDTVGDLRELALVAPAQARTQAGELDQRPDLRALEAETREAQATGALGRSLRAPNLAVGAGYAHEESDHVVFGIVGISLPVFSRGQGEVAAAKAREARATTERDALRNTAAVEANTADALVQRASAAALAFEREGLAQLSRTAELTTVGYDKGAVAYDAVLVVRLELVSAMIDYTDLLHAAAAARVELAASTGALR